MTRIARIAQVALALVALTACSSSSGTGSACQDDTNCPVGLFCFTGGHIAGGYCTAHCDTAGSQAGCASDAVCVETASNTVTENLCLRVCRSSVDCRADYSCAASPATSLRSCQPN